jgi:uncharacterized membrane protein YidH (DUF202 family)
MASTSINWESKKVKVAVVIIVIGVVLLITGATSFSSAWYSYTLGCELQKKTTVAQYISSDIEEIAQKKYDLCLKEAEVKIKWSKPVLIVGAIMTGLCLIIGCIIALILYFKNK